jgi:nucleoside-triphosphatase
MARTGRSSGARHILVTGPPGIGKTTVMMRLAELLQDRRLAGFYTDEIREGGQREGFRVTTVSGQTAILAHVDIRTGRSVGRYGVDVAAFEALVLPELARPADLVVVDEIGKMECLSPRFVSAVRALLNGDTGVVATVAIKGGGFVAEVRRRTDIQIWPVSSDNRDSLPEDLATALARPILHPKN